MLILSRHHPGGVFRNSDTFSAFPTAMLHTNRPQDEMDTSLLPTKNLYTTNNSCLLTPYFHYSNANVQFPC